MKRTTTGVMSSLVHRSWASLNARFSIVATEQESAYYAWVDEYLDRLHTEATAARPELVRPAMAPTLDDVASA